MIRETADVISAIAGIPLISVKDACVDVPDLAHTAEVLRSARISGQVQYSL